MRQKKNPLKLTVTRSNFNSKTMRIPEDKVAKRKTYQKNCKENIENKITGRQRYGGGEVIEAEMPTQDQ